MLFSRVKFADVNNGGLPQQSCQGSGLSFANFDIVEKTTDANHTLTVAEMAGGIVYYSALSAGRSVTTPTAALILAAAGPQMNIGDSFVFIVSIQDAFAITWVAGTDVTLRGKATTAASSQTSIVVKKTSATTVDWFVV